MCCIQTDNLSTATTYYCQGQRQTRGQTGRGIQQDQMLQLPDYLHW